MFDKDKWQEINHVLSRNKLRTALTAFGVSWGIFMLMIMLGAGSGLQNGIMSEFGNTATNSVFMWTQKTTIPYKGFPQGRFFNFDNDDTKALKDGIPEIKYLAPRAQLGGYRGGNNVSRGIKTAALSVNGDVPDFFKIQPMNLIKGRFLNPTDLDEYRKVAVLGKRAFEILFNKGENPIGESIEINGVYFLVVGVFDNVRKQSDEDEESQTIYIPFTTFQKAFNWGNAVGWYSITSKDGIAVSLVEEKAKKIIRERHSIHPEDDQAIGSWNMEVEFNKFMGLFLGINVLVWLVGLGTLTAGVIGVSNIMLVIVKERTKEIGIKRALGARPWNISSQIILESILITAVAGISGLMAGVAVIELVSKIVGEDAGMFLHPSVSLTVALSSIVILVVSGAFAGFIPARKAIAIKPIDALRAE